MITINFLNGNAPLEIDAKSVAEAVEKAIKSRADLSVANLCRADLSGADLRLANLCWADLSGADLRLAKLGMADLFGADLFGADLSGADLFGANLCRANLCGADLSGANLDYSCWPLWCGSLNVKVDKRIFCQLLYHAMRAGQSVDDPEVAAILKNADVLRLANQFHRVDECGKIGEVEA